VLSDAGSTPAASTTSLRSVPFGAGRQATGHRPLGLAPRLNSRRLHHLALAREVVSRLSQVSQAFGPRNSGLLERHDAVGLVDGLDQRRLRDRDAGS